MNTVELHPAFFWDCDQCGRQNFERGVTHEGPIDTTLEFTMLDGILVKGPSTVTCPHCGASFETE